MNIGYFALIVSFVLFLILLVGLFVPQEERREERKADYNKIYEAMRPIEL